ncbi:SGNH/GDSL hydrolase family protein [Saccharothrix syringae]|nr:SGNH/GDSL hydrolase family protein [Saccharothrix syringae]
MATTLTAVTAPASRVGRAAWPRWAGTWAAMPQPTEPGDMPPPRFTWDGLVLADTTLRQTVRVSVGGDRLRLRFSNAFSGAPLSLTAMAVALPEGDRAGAASVRPGAVRAVTFHGRGSAVVPVGAHVVSDPVDLPLASRANLTVTTYLAPGRASGEITSHPGSRTTSHLPADDHVTVPDLPGATPTDHWYFLSGVEVEAASGTVAVVVLGDSLTDGRGSTTNGNDWWPDLLQDRLPAGVAVLNQGAGGNRVLNDGKGPNALARLDRDVPAQSEVAWLVVFEGVNDPAGHRESARRAVNDRVRASGRFDAVVDFDAAARRRVR